MPSNIEFIETERLVAALLAQQDYEEINTSSHGTELYRNAFMDAAIKEIAARNPNFVAESTFTSAGHSKWEQINLDDGKTHLIPYNIGNYHWVMLAINSDHIIYIDPLGSAPDQETVREALLRSAPRVPERFIFINSRIQNDGINCGPISLFAAEILLSANRLPNSQAELNSLLFVPNPNDLRARYNKLLGVEYNVEKNRRIPYSVNLKESSRTPRHRYNENLTRQGNLSELTHNYTPRRIERANSSNVIILHRTPKLSSNEPFSTVTNSILNTQYITPRIETRSPYVSKSLNTNYRSRPSARNKVVRNRRLNLKKTRYSRYGLTTLNQRRSASHY